MPSAFTGFKVTDPKATGQSAAEKFAATFWQDPREIESWTGSQFKIVDGGIYQPRMVLGGVEIWRVE